MDRQLQLEWNRPRTVVFTNPRIHARADRERLERAIEQFSLDGYLWFATSGSSGEPKWVALSYEAMRCSARAVNQFLEIEATDRWLNVLPHFHVGGQSIFARAHLSGSDVIDHSREKWDAGHLVRWIQDDEAQWLSLVPTQIYDLVSLKLSAPPSLKGVLVGGGRLSGELWGRAIELGWPLHVTYGMTECSSQIATSARNERSLRLLPHCEVKFDERNQLWVKSDSLCVGWIDGEQWHPREDEYLLTGDLGQVSAQGLEVWGRAGRVAKVKGELVGLDDLEAKALDGLPANRCAMIFIPHERDENEVALVATPGLQLSLESLNLKLPPFVKIEKTFEIAELPLTELGKIRHSEILKLIEI